MQRDSKNPPASSALSPSHHCPENLQQNSHQSAEVYLNARRHAHFSMKIKLLPPLLTSSNHLSLLKGSQLSQSNSDLTTVSGKFTFLLHCLVPHDCLFLPVYSLFFVSILHFLSQCKAAAFFLHLFFLVHLVPQAHVKHHSMVSSKRHFAGKASGRKKEELHHHHTTLK